MALSAYEEIAIEILVRLLRDGVTLDAAMRTRVAEAARSLLMERAVSSASSGEKKAS